MNFSSTLDVWIDVTELTDKQHSSLVYGLYNEWNFKGIKKREQNGDRLFTSGNLITCETDLTEEYSIAEDAENTIKLLMSDVREWSGTPNIRFEIKIIYEDDDKYSDELNFSQTWYSHGMNNEKTYDEVVPLIKPVLFDFYEEKEIKLIHRLDNILTLERLGDYVKKLKRVFREKVKYKTPKMSVIDCGELHKKKETYITLARGPEGDVYVKVCVNCNNPTEKPEFG